MLPQLSGDPTYTVWLVINYLRRQGTTATNVEKQSNFCPVRYNRMITIISLEFSPVIDLVQLQTM